MIKINARGERSKQNITALVEANGGTVVKMSNASPSEMYINLIGVPLNKKMQLVKEIKKL